MTSDYQAGGATYLYPEAGDSCPRSSAKVILLTKGGVATTGQWDPNFCEGWAPLPKRDKTKEALIAQRNKNTHAKS
jgi:hypothetical protein